MKIKKIYVTGFKSFVDRHEILFPSGLSAIVGPNGCGKSNIVDAIRWALGEQSAKILRGRQMEDVIFSGAEGQKPVGMAEVSILFENGDGSFPGQFAHDSEMSVTRRLYRSGESEYLLNSVPCRLKDIQEIFMDTGLGNRAYSIIGQGKIGSIIEQKPEETRAMLEEAAGITKYRKKVDESQRKIELTRQNLCRVEDILGEVERQIRSLKRQAAKARRFKSLAQEIRRLDVLLNAHAYHELQEESGNRTRSTGDLLQQEAELSARFSASLAKVEGMNLELEEEDRKISGLRDIFAQASEKVNRKESLLESMAGEKRMQAELEKRLLQENQDIGKRLTELQGEKEVLLQKIRKARQSAVSLQEEGAILEKRAKGRQAQLAEIKEVYEEGRTRLNSGVSKEMSLNQESGYLNQRIGEITNSRSRREKEREEVRLKMDGLRNVSQRKNEVREAVTGKLKEIQEDISREQERHEALDRKRNALDADLRAAETELNLHQSRLTSLRSLAENFEGYKMGVRTIMKATDLEARREGRVMGLVADIIQAEPRVEQAVEAVLGDRLQYVIVESQKDGKEAVEYLKTRGKGRSTFVPMTDLAGNGNGLKRNGYPLLRDLVSVPEAFQGLIDVLLGDAALVEDLDKAISTWRENGKDQCLVTPDGDVVERSGIISGGRLAHHSHGLLARKREIQELEVRVARYRTQAEELKARVEGAVSEMEESKKTLGLLAEERQGCQDRINELDKTIFQLSHEMDQMERLSQRISEELEHDEKEKGRHEEALGKIETELVRCREKRRQEEEYLLQKERELRESEEEFEQLRNEIARLRMEQGLAREEEKGFIREVERIDAFCRDAQERSRKIGEEIASAKARYVEYVKREEALKEELKDFHEDLERAKEAVEDAEEERNRFRNTIREEEKISETRRVDLETLREKVHTARMEQSEISFKMGSLVEMIRDRHGILLNDVYRQYLKDDFSSAETKDKLEHLKKLKERLGEVNLTAIQEHEALKERYTFITSQREDLLKSIDSLNEAIRKINKTSLEKFMETFQDVDKKLKVVFPILFSGGTAGLKLADETKPLESGVLVEVQPPGKKLSHMGLLSGGEKALVAMALLFAIYLIKPSPFCLLDEVDAPLDEANIDRFNELLREIKKYSQIILVTHNRRSMEIVDRLYGVTMEKMGVSKMVSVNLQGMSGN